MGVPFTSTAVKRVILFLFLSVTCRAVGQTALPGSGNCLNLGGFSEYVNAGQQNRGIANKITVEAWVKTDNFDYTWIVGKYSNSLGEDGGYHLILLGGKATFNGRDGSGEYRSSGYSNTIVTDNNWHHLAGICNNGRWEIWVDGILESALNTGFTATDLTTAQAYLTVGNYYEYDTNYFRGNIDEVRIWKTARTKEQLRANMCRKLTGNDANLVAYYKFDENSNTLVKDFSRSNVAGQLVNAAGNAVLVTSGAPIGDESVEVYPTSWLNAKLELSGLTNHIFRVSNIAPPTQGIHLYRVNQAPNSAQGIPNNSLPNSYFGVFTVAPAAVDYTIAYTTNQSDTCSTLYSRADNAHVLWNALVTENKVVTGSNEINLTKTKEKYRGEYILSSVDPSPVTIIGETVICPQSFLTLQANAKNAFKYLWSTGEVTSTIRIDKPGPYSVKAFASDQCFSEDSITVTSVTVPKVTIAGDSVICPDSTVVLQVKAAHLFKYLWNTGETTSSIRVSKPGTYSVKAFAAEQCFTEASVEVSAPAFEDCKPPVQHVFIPNIITPNGDNQNETFYIKNMELNRWQLKIFNRWGKLVYSSNGYLNDWNAQDVADGIYYYVLNAPDHSKSYKGYLEVIK